MAKRGQIVMEMNRPVLNEDGNKENHATWEDFFSFFCSIYNSFLRWSSISIYLL